MQLLSDMTVLVKLYVLSMIGYTIFICSPDANLALTYFANCVFVGSMGGWQNLTFLIAELRVPPQSLGAVNMIAGTVSIGSATLSPFIS